MKNGWWGKKRMSCIMMTILTVSMFLPFFMTNVFAKPNKNSSHFICLGKECYKCSIGRSGIVANKIEGDGATPLGTFKIRKVYYRPDRIDPAKLKTNIPLVPLAKNDAWCDEVNSNQYNKLVKLPFNYSHENLWRDDHVYDVIAILSYNDDPIIKGKGSAVFLHIARENYAPTAGCIALNSHDLFKLISRFTIKNEIETALSGNSLVK